MEKLLKGTKKLSQIISNASQNNERFILYGDADLDGIASVIIFKETLEILNQNYKTKNKPIVYFLTEKTMVMALLLLLLKN